ncbi:MAG TPA: hypothetical protein VK395_13615 [Gemmataceae bacterium]|nr:hypothetical protein [Gemmataceae bacterium]
MTARFQSWAALLAGLAVTVLLHAPSFSAEAKGASTLKAGFGEADITPQLGKKPVYMAGFGQNRQATGVHDPLKARAMVFNDGGHKIAIACLDVVGFFHPNVVHVRAQLPGFAYVLVSSTHNHEGPDTLGLWGRNPFVSGVDPAYLQFVESQIVKAVHEADATAAPVNPRLGTARGPELLHDGREPYIKHDELVALQFLDPKSGKPRGLLVQWNCHPETLGDKNTRLSTDFVGPTVKYLHERFGCPVVYLTGTVGGLMTSLNVDIRNEAGKPLADGTMEKTERYGHLLGELAERALSVSKEVKLTPLAARSRNIYLPLDNPMYRLARKIGVLNREGFLWENDLYKATPTKDTSLETRTCLQTEIGWMRFGDLEVALIPGEIYPELVLSKVQDPPDPGADFPDAPIEPGIYQQMKGPYRMIVGLANDEIGYIIPKRQWDEKPPFCYGRKRAQYGEVNSVGPETAPIICRAFKDLVEAQK